jgi:hypothetical protein
MANLKVLIIIGAILMLKKIMLFISLALPLIVHAEGNSNYSVSKYAGQEQQKIKSLTPSDIEELQRGGGWGLARAAELNGVPGPAHLLELKDKIPLTVDQIEQITEIYSTMQTDAIEQGLKLIELEQGLEVHFQDRSINEVILQDYLAKIAHTRMTLRYIHLATHLLTPEILTETQITTYNQLRGYDKPDVCTQVPEGHNADAWRKHNGCE